MRDERVTSLYNAARDFTTNIGRGAFLDFGDVQNEEITHLLNQLKQAVKGLAMLTPKDYQFALLSQGACNASGLIYGLAEVAEKIRDETLRAGKGTDAFNMHPIIRLYVEQLYHLASGKDYFDAHKECEKRSIEDYESNALE